MNKTNIKEINKNNINELPCANCMKYMAKDIRNSRIWKDRAEIITYLNNIPDPNVTGKILNLLKSLIQ